MKRTLKQVFAAAVALMIAAPFASVYALVPTSPGAEQKEPPKDCKMKPEDPRCKDDKKY
jgi:hypothetical protein